MSYYEHHLCEITYETPLFLYHVAVALYKLKKEKELTLALPKFKGSGLSIRLFVRDIVVMILEEPKMSCNVPDGLDNVSNILNEKDIEIQLSYIYEVLLRTDYSEGIQPIDK